MHPEDELSSNDAHGSHGGIVALSVGALGVVFGDIGTSPLYALRESFHGHHMKVTEPAVLGACSLAFWALVIIISVKYLFFVMRANNRGEGGILALTSLVVPSRGFAPGKVRASLILLGLFGCALLYGDGIITPAISVLSAVEGFTVAAPGIEAWVIPIALVILVALFLVQPRGTGGIGKVFGPVMIVWFAVLALLGLVHVLRDPSVLASVSPTHAIDYFRVNGIKAFLSLGSIFLVVTGGEALYADMGHFGRRPITISWYAVVFPALLLNYWGQGAMLIDDPEAIENPLFHMGPSWSVVPLAILATAATVIASQALISGAFSMTAQAVQMDYLPRVAIRHTSHSHSGQIFIPIVNWLLMGACIVTVVGFRTSSNLAAAYGIAVTSTMAITTLLFGAVAHERWKWPVWKALAVVVPLLAIDLSFLAANLVKIPHGGWFPLLVGGSQLLLMVTWRKGRELVATAVKRGEQSLPDYLARNIAGVTRVPGTGVFLFKDPGAVPPSLLTNVRHNKVLHEQVLIVSVLTEDVPRVERARQAEVESLGQGFFQVRVRVGFMDEADLPAILSSIDNAALHFDPTDVTYFLGGETVISIEGAGMARWRERLFAFQDQTAASAGRFFNLPAQQVLEVGSHVEI